MNLVGEIFRVHVAREHTWDDTLKEKVDIFYGDTFLVFWDVGYCRLLKLDNGHVFHMNREAVEWFCRRG